MKVTVAVKVGGGDASCVGGELFSVGADDDCSVGVRVGEELCNEVGFFVLTTLLGTLVGGGLLDGDDEWEIVEVREGDVVLS